MSLSTVAFLAGMAVLTYASATSCDPSTASCTVDDGVNLLQNAELSTLLAALKAVAKSNGHGHKHASVKEHAHKQQHEKHDEQEVAKPEPETESASVAKPAKALKHKATADEGAKCRDKAHLKEDDKAHQCGKGLACVGFEEGKQWGACQSKAALEAKEVEKKDAEAALKVSPATQRDDSEEAAPEVKEGATEAAETSLVQASKPEPETESASVAKPAKALKHKATAGEGAKCRDKAHLKEDDKAHQCGKGLACVGFEEGKQWGACQSKAALEAKEVEQKDAEAALKVSPAAQKEHHKAGKDAHKKKKKKSNNL